MSDITSPTQAPPLEPHKAGWWRDRMTDLGFWGVVAILYLVGVIILSAFTGTSGATGSLILTLLIIGIAALGVIFALAAIRRVAARRAEDEPD
jgi:uncharacterized membrane protein YhaH (DUF805 family)